jgi:hypothetical protein
MRRHKVTLTTVGSNGSAIASNATDRVFIFGMLPNIFIAPGAGQASGVDVTVYEQIDANKRTLLAASNISAATNYAILVQAKDSAGADISGVHVVPSVAGDILIEVAGGNDGKTVDVYFYVEDSKVV